MRLHGARYECYNNPPGRLPTETCRKTDAVKVDAQNYTACSHGARKVFDAPLSSPVGAQKPQCVTVSLPRGVERTSEEALLEPSVVRHFASWHHLRYKPENKKHE